MRILHTRRTVWSHALVGKVDTFDGVKLGKDILSPSTYIFAICVEKQRDLGITIMLQTN